MEGNIKNPERRGFIEECKGRGVTTEGGVIFPLLPERDLPPVRGTRVVLGRGRGSHLPPSPLVRAREPARLGAYSCPFLPDSPS